MSGQKQSPPSEDLTESTPNPTAPQASSDEIQAKEVGPDSAGAQPDDPPSGETSPEELLASLRAALAEKEAEVQALRDHLLRERADLENFKRRMTREKSEALRFATEPLLRDVIPVLDNLERAISATYSGAGEALLDGPVKALATGVDMVLKGALDVLGRHGVTRIQAQGQAFDPACHEALAQVETADQAEGTVVAEFCAGYKLHDRLLRPAQVSVARAARPSDPSADS